MPPKAPTSLWQRIIAAVRRDPQKAGILTLLVAILVVLQVRQRDDERALAAL